MQNIILFLALFTLTATAVQLSLLRRWWQQLLFVALLVLIIYGFYQSAVQYSSTDLAMRLKNANAMLDLSVVLVLEAAVMLILALFMLRDIYSKLEMPWMLVLLLQYLPTVTCIGVLCYYQIQLYQQALPYDFATIALGYGAIAGLAMLLMAYLIKLLIPARVLRLELKLAMHAAQIVLAIAISVLTASYPYRGSNIDSNVTAFLAVALLGFGGVLVGLYKHKKAMRQLFINHGLGE